MAASVSAVLALWKAGLPVSISYSTDPKENWSDRKSTGRALACSGDMYSTVPITVPGRVCTLRVSTDSAPVGGASFAKPKSRILKLRQSRNACDAARSIPCPISVIGKKAGGLVLSAISVGKKTSSIRDGLLWLKSVWPHERHYPSSVLSAYPSAYFADSGGTN